MAYTTIDDPTIYFNTVLFTGTASGNKAVTGVGFQPDFVWTKNRVDAYGHNLYDSVRGTGKYLQSNGNSAESSSATSMVSFDSDGFTVGTGDNVQYSSNNGVSWNWKAGGSASSNSNGSITSSVSANTTAGFSIVSWTGSGSGATIGHGLGVQPQIVFVKNRDDTASWSIYTVDGGGGKGLFLNESNGFDSDSSYFNNGTASSTTFPVGTANISNGSSDNMIAYCFANVKGYSKIGSYTGNGNADGPFLYLGFKPAWILIKRTDGGTDNWNLYDNKRLGYNTNYSFLIPNESNAENTTTSTANLDIVSNGCKIRGSTGHTNTSGGTYIYMAFAENPFVTSTGIPTTAR